MVLSDSSPTTTESRGPTSSRHQRQVLGSFNYYNGWGTPALNDLTIIEGTSPDNKKYELPVTDLRSLPTPLSSYTHEKHGFQIVRQPLPISPSPAAVHDEKVMKKEYYPSMTALLKKTLGARSAIVRKHSLRDIPDWATVGMNPEIGFEIESLAPFSIAHSDYTPAGARGHFRAMKEPDWFVENDTEDGCTTSAERAEFFRLRREIIDAEDRAIAEAGLGPEVQGKGTLPRGGHWDWDGANYKGPRYAFFSIWRAWETVRRDPLAVMDMSRPVSRRVEYAPLTRTYRDRPGCVPFYYSQNALIRPLRQGRRDSGFESGDDGSGNGAAGNEPAWCYLGEQTPEEVYFLKFYDSEALVRKGRGEDEIQLLCPHSAFQVAGTDEAPARRSCELRVWCIW
ncbi:GA4 desaturase [Colletotrichum cereale]|nr:GA4 desaturase [Colletotrichum cereale]